MTTLSFRNLGCGTSIDLRRNSSRRWIETADPLLVWMNNSVFIAVGGRRPTGVTYDVYRVD